MVSKSTHFRTKEGANNHEEIWLSQNKYKSTLDEAVKIHRATIEKSGGGDIGDLDLGKLDSVLTHIQNDNYYPTFIDKLVHLFFCSGKYDWQLLQDGN